MHCPNYAQICKFVLKLQSSFYNSTCLQLSAWAFPILGVRCYLPVQCFLYKTCNCTPQTETQNLKATMTNQQTSVDQISYILRISPLDRCGLFRLTGWMWRESFLSCHRPSLSTSQPSTSLPHFPVSLKQWAGANQLTLTSHGLV